MTYYTLAVDPDRIGMLQTFSASEALYEMLSVASVYFQLESYVNDESMSKVMIKYD